MLETKPAFEAQGKCNFYPRLAQRVGLTLVMFSRSACRTCRIVEARLPGIAAAIGIARLAIVDVKTCSGIARAFEVFRLPPSALFHDGVFDAEINSDTALQPFSKAIGQALAGPAQAAP